MTQSAAAQFAPLRSADVGRRGGWPRLLIALAALAVLWLGVLPYIGGQPELAARIRRQQAEGIDPSAMFYTELEMMPEVIRHGEHLPSLSFGLRPSYGGPYSSPDSRRTPAR
jgi:hypothetical protein